MSKMEKGLRLLEMISVLFINNIISSRERDYLFKRVVKEYPELSQKARKT